MSTPPLLIAGTLLLWGWQTGQLAFAVPMALLLEGARLVPWRWEIRDRDFNRIADFSSLLFLVTVLYQFNARGIHGIYSILAMVPFVLFLLTVAQAYSRRGTVRMSALFVSLRNKGDALPRPDDGELDLAPPYALVCLVAASAGMRTDWFFAGVCVALAWLLWSRRPRRYRVVSWAGLLVLALALGFAGQLGVREVQRAVERSVLLWFNDMAWAQTNANRASTAIGAIGRMKLSDRIRVRVRPEGPVHLPLLLREASYDQFGYGNWHTTRREFTVIDADPGGAAWTLESTGAPGRAMTITTRFDEELGVAPLPYGTTRIIDEDLLEVQRNDYGAIRIEVPPGQVGYRVRHDPGATDRLPPAEADLKVPPNYREPLGRILDTLQAGGREPSDVVGALRRYFAREFRYSLIQRGGWPGRTPLLRFLEDTRKGHCEYFASATVLLLRAAGIPARYAVGYAVSEYSGLEDQYVARARHAHSWAEAWVDGRWRVVDTTPARWAELEADQASPLQPLMDLWSWAGYHVERIRQGESGLTRHYPWLLVPLIALLAWRLYGRERVRRGAGPRPAHARPRHGLDSEFNAVVERLAAQGYGPRAGEPLGAWARRVRAAHPALEVREQMDALLALHYRLRFDPKGLPAAERALLRERARGCLQALLSRSPAPGRR